jgi:hypothetical protein
LPSSSPDFIEALVAIIQPDAVFLDNVMSLAPGPQKDEETWAGALPVVHFLAVKGISQIWGDHTGWDTSRQYGTNTKQWKFDCVANLTPIEDVPPEETAFGLSFDPPGGKARRRTPANWRQFEPSIVRLVDDVWTREPAERDSDKQTKLRPEHQLFYSALLDAIAATGGTGETTEDAWLAECIRRGLIDPPDPSDDYKERDSKRKPFRRAKSAILAAGCIGCDGKRVMLAKGRHQ